MIKDPKELMRIIFYDDWDLGRDRIIGVLYIPRAIRGDIRWLVDLHVESNMVHPDLRYWGDPWAEERKKKHEQAIRDYPRRFIYPVETIIPRLTEDGQLWRAENGAIQILEHSLYYQPGEYKPQTKSTAFRPQKEG